MTALCPADGGICATAFGRTGDQTQYETQVVSASLAELVSKLTDLANDGYVITALGRDGTGVDGAGRPRKSLLAEGFAVVGTIFHGAGADCSGAPTWLYIGER